MTPPATPYLRLDLERLNRNIEATARWVADRGLRLRPHVKMHKSPDVARLQLAAGAVGLTVATIGEAEVMAAAGCEDLFIAYPLHVNDQAVRRLTAVASVATVALGVDSEAGARHAGSALAGTGIEVMVEIDCGHHRTGCSPTAAGQVAAAASSAGVGVRGVFTFPGHSYDPQARSAAAQNEASALATARRSVDEQGLSISTVSGGSTPSLAYTDADVLTEVRPGVYAFGDAQQWELGAIEPSHIALTCRATVVSHAGGRAVLDSGSKALAADRGFYNTGGGRLLDHPEARIVLLSEQHAVVDMGPRPLPPIGSQVDVVPNHCCAATNLADTMWADDGAGLHPWPVAARGLNH